MQNKSRVAGFIKYMYLMSGGHLPQRKQIRLDELPETQAFKMMKAEQKRARRATRNQINDYARKVNNYHDY